MKTILFFLGVNVFCFSQDSAKKNQNLNSSYAINSASFFNHGTSGYEIDGFIEFQMNNRFFIESSINYEIGERFSLKFDDNQTLSFSSSLGAMKPITKSLYAIGGLSNYTELNNDNLNEVFFGTISRYLTTIFYAGIEGGSALNFLGIMDINSFLTVNIPINISIMITYTSSSIGKQVGKWTASENGMDIYFRISKEYNSRISIGYNFSRERYETFESRTFQKSGGETFVKNMPHTETGFFHTVYIGLLF
tara:strand:+ start:1251 stop:2000 length:750 start_codon:yes stop_codon:yes gene_type:complete